VNRTQLVVDEVAVEVGFAAYCFTSALAEEILQAAELTNKQRKKQFDTIASQITLTA
jgi:hypothetical protein